MRSILALIALLACAGAHAALLGRAPLTPGGADYQAYYDTAQNITWLADANYAATSGYQVGGLLNWYEAQAWIGSLNTASHLGKSDWRLPLVTDTGAPGCNYATGGTDCGYNVDLSTGEMAHLFYSTLGNQGSFASNGMPTGCGFSSTCLVNDGPFVNLQSNTYWAGTVATNRCPTSCAWRFIFNQGIQNEENMGFHNYTWAVRSGDIAPVPMPAAVWLFCSALGVMGWMRRRPSDLLPNLVPP